MIILDGDFLRAAARRWRQLAFALALTMSLAGLYLFVAPHRYAATLSLGVNVSTDPGDLLQPQNPARMEDAMRLLTSKEVLRGVVEGERLRLDPDFALAKPASIVAAAESLFSGGLRRIETTDDAILEALARAVAVRRGAAPAIIDVDVLAASPEKAQRLALGLASAFLGAQAKIGAASRGATSAELDGKLAALQSRMEEAERRLADYRKANPLVDAEPLLEPRLDDSKAALNEARAKRAEAERKYAQAQAAIRAGGGSDALGDALHSPLLEKLRAEYAALAREAAYAQSSLLPRHPAYVAAKAQLAAAQERVVAELRRIAQSAKHEADAARAAEAAAAREAGAKRPSGDAPAAPLAEFVDLRRDAANARERYELALAERPLPRAEPGVAKGAALLGPPVLRQDLAEPKAAPTLLAALAAGVVLGFAGAAGAEFLARRAAKPATEAMVLTLPQFDPCRDGRGGPRVRAREIMETPGEPFRATIHGLYEALSRRRAAAPGALTIAVAARESGAGASITALALALFAASQGERVLLIESAGRRRGPKALRAHRYGAGQILLASGEAWLARLKQARFRSRLDLIVLDCGAPSQAVDATIVVSRDRRAGSRQARLLFREERDASGERSPPRQLAKAA